MFKYAIGFVLLSFVSYLVGVSVWRLGADATTEFRTAPVQDDKLVVSVTASGTIEPEGIVDVGAHVAGPIARLGADPDHPDRNIDYGSRVQKGTLLAQIDDSLFQAKVDQMQAHVLKAEAELEGAKARYSRAELNWKRAQELMQRNISSDREYDAALADFEISKAEIAIANAAVSQAKAGLKQAETDLGYTTIKSPIDGVIIDRRVNVGQTLVAGLDAPSLFLLARDLGELEIWASVNEADIGMIRVGQKVEFRVDAYPRQSFHGEVTQIRLNASMTQNVVTYTVIVKCRNQDGRLLPFMTANLRFLVAQRENALTVPNQALRWWPTLEQVVPEHREAFQAGDLPRISTAARPAPVDDGEATLVPGVVWVVADEGLVRPVRVQVGLNDGLRSELVTKDLSAGDPVIIGEKVRESDIGNFTSTFVQLPGRGEEEEE